MDDHIGQSAGGFLLIQSITTADLKVSFPYLVLAIMALSDVYINTPAASEAIPASLASLYCPAGLPHLCLPGVHYEKKPEAIIPL